MKLAVMQPYFFPYIGYFQLIHAADRFILADDVQYIRHGWINRNRILKPVDGSIYMVAPVVKSHYKTFIKDIQLVEGDEWKQKILRQVEHYRKKAPFYNEVRQLLEDCLALQQPSIARFNAYCLQQVCRYLSIPFTVEFQSEVVKGFQKVTDLNERPVSICKEVGAAEYINPIGGTELYRKEIFQKEGLELNFLKPFLKSYNQHREVFTPSLSILDVMMFNTPEEVRHLLNTYELI